MVSLTAADVLAQNYYRSTDFDPAADETTSLTNVEGIIDDIIDYINVEAGTSISAMSGTAGSKTVTLTREQNAVIKLILPVTLKERKYKISTSSALGPASISESVGSQDSVFKEMFWKAINRLKEYDWGYAII